MTARKQTKRAGIAFAGKVPAKVRKTRGAAGPRAARAVVADGGVRPSSKQALLVERLSRPEGARIDDLTKELRWLPHTVRAAMTGLRRKGYVVAREKTGSEASIYRAKLPATQRVSTSQKGRKSTRSASKRAA